MYLEIVLDVIDNDRRSDIMKLFESEIYIGVQDNGKIIGLDNSDFVMQQISNSLRYYIRSDLAMFVNTDLLKIG